MVTTRRAAHSDVNDDTKTSGSQTSRIITSRKQKPAQNTQPAPSHRLTSVRVTRNASSQKRDDVPNNTQSDLGDEKKKTASCAASGANTLTRSAAARKEQAASEDTQSKRAALEKDVVKSEDTKSKVKIPIQKAATSSRTNTLTRSQRAAAAANKKNAEQSSVRKSSVRSNDIIAKDAAQSQRPAPIKTQSQQRRTSTRITALAREQESKDNTIDQEAASKEEHARDKDADIGEHSEKVPQKTTTITKGASKSGKSKNVQNVKNRDIISNHKSQPSSSAQKKSIRSISQPFATKKVSQTSRKPRATTNLGKRKAVAKTSSFGTRRASKRLKLADEDALIAEDVENESEKVIESSRRTPRSKKSVSPVKRQTESPLSDLTSAPTTPSDIVMPDLNDAVEENGESDRERSEDEDQDEVDASMSKYSKYNLDDSEDELAGPKTPMRRSAAPRRLNKSPMIRLNKRQLRSKTIPEVQDNVSELAEPGVVTSQDSITIQGDEPGTMSTLRETQTGQQESVDVSWQRQDNMDIDHEESNPFSLSVISNSENLFGVPVEMGDLNETIIDVDDHLTSSPSSNNSVIITRREKYPYDEEMKDDGNAEDGEDREDNRNPEDEDFDEDYPRLSMTAKTPRPQTIDWNAIENEDDTAAEEVGIMSDVLSSPTKRKIEEAVREEVEDGVDETLQFSEFVSMPTVDNVEDDISMDEAVGTSVMDGRNEIVEPEIEPGSGEVVNDGLSIPEEIQGDAESEEQADIVVQADEQEEHALAMTRADQPEEHAESTSQADEQAYDFNEQNVIDFVEEVYEHVMPAQPVSVGKQVIVDDVSDAEIRAFDTAQVNLIPHLQDTAQETLEDPFIASADESQAATQFAEQQSLAFDNVLEDAQQLIALDKANLDSDAEQAHSVDTHKDLIDRTERVSAEVDNAQSLIDHIPPSIASIFEKRVDEKEQPSQGQPLHEQPLQQQPSQEQPSKEEPSQGSSHEVSRSEQIPHYMQSTISFRRKSLPSAAHLYTPVRSGVRPKTSGADLPANESLNEPWWVRARSQSRVSTAVTTPAVSPAKPTRVFAPFAVSTPRHNINLTAAVQSARAGTRYNQELQRSKYDRPQTVAATRPKRLPTGPAQGSPIRRLLPGTPRRTPLKSITSSIALPMTPHPAIPLRGVVAIVEVYTLEGSCASSQFVTALSRLGAKTTKIWSDRVTHVIFKDGPPSVLQKVANHNKRVAASGGTVIHCVCSRWISDCDTAGTRLDETDETYAVDTSFVPTSNKRKRKSMEPATIVNIGGSLKKDRKSSWGRSTSSLFGSSSRETSITAARDGGKENLDSTSPATPTWLRAPEELTPTTAPVKRVRRLEPVGFDRFKARRRTLLNHF